MELLRSSSSLATTCGSAGGIALRWLRRKGSVSAGPADDSRVMARYALAASSPARSCHSDSTSLAASAVLVAAIGRTISATSHKSTVESFDPEASVLPSADSARA